MSETFQVQVLPPWHRLVLKIGSSLLTDEHGKLSDAHARRLARFVIASRATGREVVLVSSGAVTAGRVVMAARGLVAGHGRGHHFAHRQALAALGQTRMVALWQDLFERPLAQVLLTHDDLRNRRRYLNARATIEELLRYGIVPVVNENDSVAVDELTFGDNDNLAAIVAGLVGADLLLIATDVAGLYSADPHADARAQPVDAVRALTPAVLAMATGTASTFGTGGMRSKLDAAQKAAAAGIDTILFNGRDPEVAELLIRGKLRGTRVYSPCSRRRARTHWLLHAPASSGGIRIDAGAARALRNGGASLLPTGVIGVEGAFQRGDVVEIAVVDEPLPIARGITQYGASELRLICGCHSGAIRDRLGYTYGSAVVHRNDLVTRPAAMRGVTAGVQVRA
ncbi:MAG: glutamate 5-kinase [Rhodanobacteraceae bacterium]